MPYTHIAFRHIADKPTSKLFERASDFLADVYTMLSDGPAKEKSEGGGHCNLTAPLVLFCIVDAIATEHWPKEPTGENTQGPRFTHLLREKLPWGPGHKGSGWVPKHEAVHVFYGQFRNTLTHALGADRESKHLDYGFAEPTSGPWGDIPSERRNIGAIDALTAWPKEWPVLSVRTDDKGTRHKLTVVALYWAVKKMVAELAAAA
jgi:hypothetical protein